MSKTRTRTRCAAALATLGLLTVLAAPTSAWAQTDAALSARLKERFEGDRTGACAVAAIVEPTGVQRALACAAPRKDGGPTLDDAFEIGSISKTMTAFLVADLIAAGKWTLDDPIEKHLPPDARVPSQGDRKILVRDILTHSSGLPRLPPNFNPGNAGDPYSDITEKDLLSGLAAARLQGSIGGQAVYSNFAMMVLSVAVARAHESDLDGDFERVLTERLFKPLKMDGAFVARQPAAVRLLPGHLSTGEVTPNWTFAAAPNAAGVGAVRARLDDMVRYAQAHLGLIDTPLAARLRSTQAPLAHGLGMNWNVGRFNGQDLVLHDGATGGFTALMALEPSTQRAVIVLVDTALGDSNDLGPVARSLMDDKLPVPKARRAVAMPESLRKALVGEFTLAGPGVQLSVQVRDDGGRLMAQASGQSAFELLLDDRGDVYPASTISARGTPIFEDGAVNRIAWRQGGSVMEAVRKGHSQALTAQNPAWQDWAGEYRLTPQFSLRIFERAGRLMTQGTGQMAIPAEAIGKDRIENAAVGAVIDFQRDSQGVVTGLTLRQRGQVMPGIKQPTP